MNTLILLAAGSGSRLRGVLEDKVLAPIAGRSSLARCLEVWHSFDPSGSVVIVARDNEQVSRIRALVGAPQRTRIVLGGAERQDSVLTALRQAPEGTEFVFIHDGARPLLREDNLQALLARVRRDQSAVLARRVTDTLREVTNPNPGTPQDGPAATRTLDRSRLWAMETPQVFPLAVVRQAYEAAASGGLRVTDDAAALEALGLPLSLEENHHPNPKLTTPADLPWLEHLLLRRTNDTKAMNANAPAFSNSIRIGHGFDIHRFVEGRPLVLGGVRIQHTHGLEGHSDADALTHAICDALLGALALPDIGHFFPNTDERWRGVDSQILLREVVARIQDKGWIVGNVDASIQAEKPRLAPHIDAMRRALADSLGVQPDQVGVKATTHEKLGALGRGEGLAAHAVCMLYKQRVAETP